MISKYFLQIIFVRISSLMLRVNFVKKIKFKNIDHGYHLKLDNHFLLADPKNNKFNSTCLLKVLFRYCFQVNYLTTIKRIYRVFLK